MVVSSDNICYKHMDDDAVESNTLASPEPLDALLHTNSILRSIGLEIDPEFPEVPPHLLADEKWKTIQAGAYRRSEPIHLKELRAVMWGIRRLVRSVKHHSCKHLFLGDNLGVCLAFEKGRATDPHMCKLYKNIAAVLLASGCRARLRWIPSERNPSDAPSHWHDPASHIPPPNGTVPEAPPPVAAVTCDVDHPSAEPSTWRGTVSFKQGLLSHPVPVERALARVDAVPSIRAGEPGWLRGGGSSSSGVPLGVECRDRTCPDEGAHACLTGWCADDQAPSGGGDSSTLESSGIELGAWWSKHTRDRGSRTERSERLLEECQCVHRLLRGGEAHSDRNMRCLDREQLVGVLRRDVLGRSWRGRGHETSGGVSRPVAAPPTAWLAAVLFLVRDVPSRAGAALSQR